MGPSVSVVLPVYQPHPRFFREAVQSVIDQTFGDFELIIVEDPSPSRGTEFLAGISDARIRHVVNPRRTSLPEQHNAGLSMARGSFICRFDADDICEPRRLEREIEFLRSHPQVDLVGSWLSIIDHTGRPAGVRSYPPDHEEIMRTFPRSNPIANSTVMFRASVYERFGGWCTTSALPAQDYEWYSRLAAGGARFANLPETLVRYRLHAGSIKSTRLHDTLRSTLETKRRYWRGAMSVTDRAVMSAERMLLLLPPRLVLSAFRLLRYKRER